MSADLDRGAFQGLVLARLDALKELGADVKECLKEHEKRLTLLEHMAVRAKLWGTVAGVVAGFISSKLPFFTGTRSGLYGATAGGIIFWLWPIWVIRHPKTK